MLKVLISEDEKRVCKLVQNIISWEELGFEVVDIANTGIEAINKIKLYNPDVVITDIRMPGCTGIEMIQQVNNHNIKFIIISGYKQFEYAQSAIKYGVEDYILKPIDKEELTNALIRIKKNYESIYSNEQREVELKNNERKIRGNFINYILLNNNLDNELDKNKINNEFKISFKEGKFQSIYLKVFNESNEEFKNEDILNIFIEEFKNIFRVKAHDILHSNYNGGIIFLVNYDEINEKVINEKLYSYLSILKRISKKFDKLNFILSQGRPVKELTDIFLTINKSINNIKFRINYGVNTIIEDEQVQLLPIKGKNILEDKELWNLKNIIESNNLKDFSEFIDNTIIKIDNNYFGNAICFFETLECINNTVIETYRSMEVQENKTQYLTNKYNKLINFEIDKEILINKYKIFLLGQLKEISCSSVKRELITITKAKKYIASNFQSPITLEEVADAVEISPTYLSSMFKKELGINFCDYIIELRVEMAKNILKSTNLTIAEITEKVGYTDCRYFSKLFNKVVGIKPSKYRKLYSKE